MWRNVWRNAWRIVWHTFFQKHPLGEAFFFKWCDIRVTYVWHTRDILFLDQILEEGARMSRVCHTYVTSMSCTYFFHYELPPALPPEKKKFLQFFWNLAHLKFTINKYAQYSIFREKTYFMGIKLNFKFEIWETFYKGFPRKKKLTWEFFVKWTQIKIVWNSFVNFSTGGPWSIYIGILL